MFVTIKDVNTFRLDKHVLAYWCTDNALEVMRIEWSWFSNHTVSFIITRLLLFKNIILLLVSLVDMTLKLLHITLALNHRLP